METNDIGESLFLTLEMFIRTFHTFACDRWCVIENENT